MILIMVMVMVLVVAISIVRLSSRIRNPSPRPPFHRTEDTSETSHLAHMTLHRVERNHPFQRDVAFG